MPSALSLCLIVKNEERHLASCLDSVGELAHEIVIVDTGSTDSTPQIAKRYNSLVVPFDFSVVDFAAARNHALAQASGKWILMLDADETLASGAGPMIRTLVERDEQAGYFLERRNHSGDASTTDYVVRLFPNRSDIRYRGRVHETIDDAILATGARLLKTPIRIEHNFAPDPQARRRKNHWYIEILKEEIAANPDDDSRLDFLAAEYHQLEMFREAAEVAERIVERRPMDARAHLFAGMYHLLYAPDLARARRDFERALELRPNYPEACSFLQRMDREAGK